MTAKIYNLDQFRKKKWHKKQYQLYKNINKAIINAYEIGMCDNCKCATTDLFLINNRWLCRSCIKI